MTREERKEITDFIQTCKEGIDARDLLHTFEGKVTMGETALLICVLLEAGLIEVQLKPRGDWSGM